MTDPFVLLRIAADLHAAGCDPERWSKAWQAVCDYFAWPDVLDETIPEGLSLASTLSHVAECTAKARARLEPNSGVCGDEPKFRAFRELLPHIELALRNARPGEKESDARLSALDILPFPVFLCDFQRRLLHVNASAQAELDQKIWLHQVGDHLVGATTPIESRLATSLAADAEGDRHLRLLRSGYADVELVFRQVTAGNGDRHWVLRLLHLTRHSDADFNKLASVLELTPRQAVLAHLLIGGCTLTEAARRMGIVRGSANDLLKRLFSLTGTRRQAELVGYLTRRLASR